tara:strand:+ start:3273 stop:3377 length:105 start_codon:yes stop_codon:yes gene_type:complete
MKKKKSKWINHPNEEDNALQGHFFISTNYFDGGN